MLLCSMNIDQFGKIQLNNTEVFEYLYNGRLKTLENIFLDTAETEKFNQSVERNKDRFSKLQQYQELEISIKDFDSNNQINWFMPEDYCPDLIEHLYNLCSSDEEKNRVTVELELFIQHGMLDLLFYLKYLVDTMRQNNIVWGVGRGSSVASFVLYLIGVHKINSIKYDLNINEFLK